MPILSAQDERNYYQTITASQYQEDPTFLETMGSAFDFVIDEELSISSLLNRQGYDDRNEQIFKMSNEGFDLKPYTDVTGEIDYDRISEDTGSVKSNSQLYNERTEILRKRREENQNVIERGNGLAQFIGSMGGYMLDPINVATMGVGVGTAYKGMSTLSRALMTGRNTAAIALASESAIQPLVYKHKYDIESPYEFSDALMAIGTTAIGAGLLGGAMGGIAGYFTKLSEKSSKFVSFKPIDGVFKLTPEQESIDILSKMGTQLAEQKAALPYRIEDDILKEYDAFQNKQYSTLEKARDANIVGLEKKVDTIRKENFTLARTIAEFGGLNKERFAQEGVDLADMKIAGGFGKPVFRKNGGLDPDMLAERLREEGFGDIQMNDAIDLVDEMVRNPKMFKDVGIQRQIDEIDHNINILRDDNTVLEEYYGSVIRRNVELDMELLAQNKALQDSMNKPTLTYDDYVVNELAPAPKATRTGLQREQLDSEGLSANYDRDIANFEALKNRRVLVDGKLIDGDEYMKGLDDQIEGIESVRVCALG
tara:strand:+ start:589 stop:2205 length:1617 start_codon:yes stop_codon:yes gene_type:complete